MIPYSRDPNHTIPTSSVKIIGLGGAGANMLERIALDGMEGAELMALNTDVRTLATCLAREKIQLGVNLTKGLGSGGDPELGHQAALEAEEQIRASIKGRRIVFLCTGLGGGTGSGAAPIITRIAREEGAFVVVFATMPFAFEGKRRRDQAETALNELAVLSNALVTFDNNRMGELVLAKQGIHEAFGAADHMICESIKAVIRLVVRPGIINVGLDDLMSALRTNRSRCLFGSGIADGKDRAIKALRNALNSPLLDQGTLLKDAQTVLVHLSGGEDLTLFEIELLMQRLQKFVPDTAHVLFGAAIDPAMGDSLSITLISALPEDFLAMAPRDSLSHRSQENPILDPSHGFTAPALKLSDFEPVTAPEPVMEIKPAATPEPAREPAPPVESAAKSISPPPTVESASKVTAASEPAPPAPATSPLAKFRRAASDLATAAAPSLFDTERPFAEADFAGKPSETPKPDRDLCAFTFTPEASPTIETILTGPELQIEEPSATVDAPDLLDSAPETEETYSELDEMDPEPIEESAQFNGPDLIGSGFTPLPKKRPALVAPWGRPKSTAPAEPEPENPSDFSAADDSDPVLESAAASADAGPLKLKLGIKSSGSQNELSLDSAPRGRFEGENPNVFEGEDLDLPPFLRKKK
jgi:cell division protein FtsZ